MSTGKQYPEVVKPSKQTLNRVFGNTLNTWSHFAAHSSGGLPSQTVQLSAILHSIPPFPELAGLKLKKNEKFGLGVVGRSSWHTYTDQCKTADKIISAKPMFVGRPEPVVCHFTDNPSCLLDWPGICNNSTENEVPGNYLAVMTLAWDYVLSATWAELAGDLSNITIHSEVSHHGPEAGEIIIDIGDAGVDATQWWTAILNQNHGWSATLEYEGTTFHSPWSYMLQSSWRLRVREPSTRTPSPPPSSELAMKFLADFCRLHKLEAQCSAALCAAVMMPSSTRASLPLPKPYTNLQPQQRNTRYEEAVFGERTRIRLYMTLSCYGVLPVLWGSLYHPDISCNEVSPYMEAITQVVKTTSDSSDQTRLTRLASIFGQRQPEAAGLWLGAIITGFHTTLISAFFKNRVRFIDIHALPWTKTLNSFIFNTRPILLAEKEKISREDECRLLFILNSYGSNATPPLSPWKPFGYTDIEDTDLEVRCHAACGHYLRYVAWKWDGEKKKEIINHQNTTHSTLVDRLSSEEYDDQYVADEQMLSEHCTSGVMRWLRPDGIAIAEKAIYNHEWVFEETEDEADVASSSSSSPGINRIRIDKWIGEIEKGEGV